jgi:hypothetical protein
MGNETDVVYVLGSGSRWKNNEIRFSLRSIEKYGLNVGKIFIVGECPDFLTDIIHIPANDIFNPNENADGNIANKVLMACADQRLSDNFLFINDDHILLKQISLQEIPAFHKGDMKTFPKEYWELNYWRKRLQRTMHVLRGKGLTTYHFDCHTPIVFNKNLFPEIFSQFDYSEGIGLTMKSIYGNSVSNCPGKLLGDEKKTVFKFYSYQQLDHHLSVCGFMSFNDQGLNNPLKTWLYNKFPFRSKWETTDIEDKVIEIIEWLAGSRDYDEGVRIFNKYLNGVNLSKIFEMGETPSVRKKLEYKLTNTLLS